LGSPFVVNGWAHKFQVKPGRVAAAGWHEEALGPMGLAERPLSGRSAIGKEQTAVVESRPQIQMSIFAITIASGASAKITASTT
jgi:hypothetical protein